MPMTRLEAEQELTAPGAMFEVDHLDIGGVPTRIWKNAPATLVDIVRGSRGYGDRPFIVYEDERMSYEDHYRAVARLSHALRTRFGVQPGDRVAIAMRNFPEWSVAFWAAAAAGAVVVPLNGWWTGEELAYGLRDSGTRVLIADGERVERLADELAGLSALETVIVARAEAPGPAASRSPASSGPALIAYDEVIAAAPADAELPPEDPVGPEDDATIFYTSGTTGRPKGALGTHRNICTNPMSLVFIGARGGLRTGTAPSADAGANAMLLSVPLFHATGCHSILVTNVLVGGTIVMMRRWDPARALELIERERVTTFGGVPAMVMQVLDHPDFDRRDTSSVRSVSYGGAPAPHDLVRRIREHFPAGRPSNGYGLTETSSLSTMNDGEDYVAKPDSVGPPVPVVEVKVVDPGGSALPIGDVGELWIKGPHVVKGYWNKPDATRATFSDGWLHTGDVARLDEEGFVFIVDRAKDMLIRGGENIYSVEIETVLHDHPAVADAAVIGIPHPTLGEEVGAVIQIRDGYQVDEAEIQQHVGKHLAAFKVPVRVWTVGEPLPRNPAGKILKRQLRDDLLSPERPA